jgi:hypothetical protein
LILRISDGRGDDRRRLDIVFAVLGVVAFLTLLWLARDQGFRGDDWDFIANRRLDDPIGLLRPFNEQWVTIPAAIFLMLLAVVGLHSYLPYLAVLLLLHVLVAVRVRVVTEQVAGASLGAAAGVVVLFLGVGDENLGQAFQIGMVLSTCAGIWALDELVLRHHPGRAAALLIIAIGSHAVGAAFLGAGLVIAVLRGRRALATLMVPALAFVVWFALFDIPSMSARSGSFLAAVASVPVFMASGAASTFGAMFGLSPVAGVILIGLVVVAAVTFRRRPVAPMLFIAAVVSIALEFGLIALSRAEFGLGAVLWSRYLYVGVPLALIGVAAWFGDVERRDTRWGAPLRLAIAAVATVAIAGNLRYYLLARDLGLDPVIRTRAAVGIAEWAPDLVTWNQDLHLPTPDRVREIVAAHGSPAHDDLVPGVIPEVPDAISAEMCTQLIPDQDRREGCTEAVRDGVGG